MFSGFYAIDTAKCISMMQNVLVSNNYNSLLIIKK